MEVLRLLLADEAEILHPMALGQRLPEAEGILFPQLLGTAYRQKELLKEFESIGLKESHPVTQSFWEKVKGVFKG